MLKIMLYIGVCYRRLMKEIEVKDYGILHELLGISYKLNLEKKFSDIASNICVLVYQFDLVGLFYLNML